MPSPISSITFVLMTGCLFALVVLLALWARQGRPRPRPGDGTLLFRHNSLFRWVAALTAIGLPVLLTVVLYIFPPQRLEVPYFVGMYLLFAVLTLPFVWEAGRYYLLATAVGLECRSPWRGTKTIDWSDLSAMNYSAGNAWFEFVGDNGDRLRVHTFVARVNDLLTIVELRVPARMLKGARGGYTRLGRTFPPLPEEPILEALRPRQVGEL